MKKISLFVMLAAVALLAGCQDTQREAEIATCQQEKMDLQGQLMQANATIRQKDQKVEELEGKNWELNQKALEGIRTMMEKQNAKDIELKNKLKAKEAEAATLQQKVNTLQEQLKTVKEATAVTAQTVETATEAATE